MKISLCLALIILIVPTFFLGCATQEEVERLQWQILALHDQMESQQKLIIGLSVGITVLFIALIASVALGIYAYHQLDRNGREKKDSIPGLPLDREWLEEIKKAVIIQMREESERKNSNPPMNRRLQNGRRLY